MNKVNEVNKILIVEDEAITALDLKYCLEDLGYDVVLVDTAGRLQNKDNLMRELEKINKVIGNIAKKRNCSFIIAEKPQKGKRGKKKGTCFRRCLFLNLHSDKQSMCRRCRPQTHILHYQGKGLHVSLREL